MLAVTPVAAPAVKADPTAKNNGAMINMFEYYVIDPLINQ
jgi:hypothetical protein